MEFCADCQELTDAFMSQHILWETEKTIRLDHANIRCQLCQLFHDHLLAPPDNTHCRICYNTHTNSLCSTSPSVTLKVDIYIHRGFEPVVGMERCSRCLIRYRHKEDKQLVLGHIILELWAEEGSAASERFITQPPLLIHSLEAVTDLALTWLENCNLFHEGCAAVENAPLPSRALEVSGSFDMPTVKLIETGGMTGSYCALSHCWGFEHKRPLRTLRDNLRQHLDNIAFGDLPLTFQHTVLLVRSMGIPFVRIDFLCIIQDDYQDWENEAKEMGTIYRSATCVIAAAGAKDSTEGLFNARLTESVIIRAPYISDGIETGYYNIVAGLQSPRMLDDAPLFQRAWCFPRVILG